jgi:Cof subfamily protein (haloacid dehalogenase superfamily)
MLGAHEFFPTKPTIRLVATDLDGTLLLPDGTVSARTHAVLQRVQEAGITVVLVSARPPRVLRHIAHMLGISGLAICCNGALVYDLDAYKIVQHWPLSSALARRLVVTLRRVLPDLTFAGECGLEFVCEPDFYRFFPLKVKTTMYIDDALSFCNQPLSKLIVLHSGSTVDTLQQYVAPLLGEEVIVTHSGAAFLEISAAGVTKARTLAALCEEQGISSDEVVAFGDMPNDLSMLQWAGRGVAVANAHPQVLADADEITLSNAEDGVAHVLETILLTCGLLFTYGLFLVYGLLSSCLAAEAPWS